MTVWTCLCKTPKTTFVSGTTTKTMYLCNFHAQSNREGHTFTVVPYEEAK